MCVVEAYTAMNLTKPEDKLVALSGVVSVFRRYFEEYLAGVWRIWLPKELLWPTFKAVVRSNTYRAPSWSWASTDSEISYLMRSWDTKP